MRSVHLAISAAIAVLAALAVTGAALAASPVHNGLIAFGAVTPTEGTQLFTVRPNGHDLRQITHAPGESLQPDWARDGRSLVYEHDWDTETQCATVDVIHPDGSNRVSLTSGVGGCQGQPSFTPWGSIVYEAFDFDTFDDGIWGMNGDGSNQHEIITPWPSGAGFVTDPNVSPDGTLAFVGTDGSIGGDEPPLGLFTSDLFGNAFTQLLPFTIDMSIKSDWAPDGRQLATTVNANQFHAGESANIATVRPDGSGLHYLTHYQGGDVNAYFGSYSPDGKHIVFRLEDHGVYSLIVMRSDGTHLHTILGPGPFRPRSIDWGPRAG